MQGKTLSIGLRAVLAIIAATLFVTSTWATAQEKVLHNFNNNGTDGVSPQAGLIVDGAGNSDGPTRGGGPFQHGKVFELTPAAGGGWTETVLHSFNNNGTDGYEPLAGLIFDAAGNLYGTTYVGGSYGYGTAFELTPAGGGTWNEKVLYSFASGSTAFYLTSGLIFDGAGNLYGTTLGGQGGSVFELTPTAGGGWTEKVLHSFGNGTDGEDPQAGLIFDAAGNLYGTTIAGGTYGGGTAFELTPAAGGGWTEQVLLNFDGTDGQHPYGALIFDAAGNLYGTTSYGGTYDYGTVFELTPAAGGGWTETVLHNFNDNGTDGYWPYAGLIFDAVGNLYGTTYGGGVYTSCTNGSFLGCGTVFELTPTAGGGWTEKVLHSFGNGTDGEDPQAGLIFDAAGNLYGTTIAGGTYGGGTAFELTPAAGGGWTEQVLLNFDGTDGQHPYGALIFDAAGNLYGTTSYGGTYDYGTVFELTPAAGGGWTETVLHN